jgi:predicted outer membrane lipoprotein
VKNSIMIGALMAAAFAIALIYGVPECRDTQRFSLSGILLAGCE